MSQTTSRLLLSRLGDGSPAGCDERVVHVHDAPGRVADVVELPAWTSPVLAGALTGAGLGTLWRHQRECADALHRGEHVVVATGTASGKSLGFLLPVLSDLGDGSRTLSGRGASALYLAPTKALAADQLAAVNGLALPGVRACSYDGDTPTDERRWIRAHANYVLTNPDMLHHSILPGHDRWAPFLRALRYVVIDECHSYRGVFGTHLAAVLRRLRRVCAHYGSSPTFALASATAAEPAVLAEALTGLPVRAVTSDGSPRAGTTFALWEPPTIADEAGPRRRSAVAEAGDLLADLVARDVQTVVFARSRFGAETVAAVARRRLEAQSPHLVERVAAYRGGYLPEDRRLLERGLRDGSILGLAATNALELGIDISGLDGVVIAGWPGTRASLWQQAGRAGRAGREALVLFVAADDPLDTYLLRHPEAIFGPPVEATVVDPTNPYVLAPHLAAAAAEVPLRGDDALIFGQTAPALLDRLTDRGVLRRRPDGWYWTHPYRPTDGFSLRGADEPVRVVEADSGRVVGMVDGARAHATVHTGAVYVHQGASYVVTDLDLDDAGALVVRGDPGWTTIARSVSSFDVRRALLSRPPAERPGELLPPAAVVTGGAPDDWRAREGATDWRVREGAAERRAREGATDWRVREGAAERRSRQGAADWRSPEAAAERRSPEAAAGSRARGEGGEGVIRMTYGDVLVRSRVTSFLRRLPTGEVLGEHPLDLPERTLSTKAVWWTIPEDRLRAAGVPADAVPGALHAAEHAAISLLPLIATADRWDIGGVSTALHPDTGLPTIMVYDGHPGGAGFAERGYLAAEAWLRASRDAVARCACTAGCPACVHSPKCGNGNNPLDKAGAVLVLQLLCRALRQDHDTPAQA